MNKAFTTMWCIRWAVVTALFVFAETDSAGARQMSPLERTQEVLRRLQLPPDPKLHRQWSDAVKKENVCLGQYFAANAGTPDIDARKLGASGCRACDREIVAASQLYLAANKHRYVEPDPDRLLANARRHCLDFSWLQALEAIREFKSAIAQRTSYGEFGAWQIEGRLANSGLLSYVLMARDAKSGVSVEISCRPVDQATPSNYLLGPFEDPPKGEEKIYVTYSADGNSLQQTIGHVHAGGITLAVDGVLWSILRKTHDTLFISAQGISARFSLSGFSDAEPNWRNRCLR